ncbi:MAG: MBL fold metallo-hydrolase [Clostridia bacterium]|nr:MBL fold metallo-hydrolase [Clostridia bacterium]
MKLTMLGTGCALATEYFNTCFLMQDEGGTLLVDGGGGNGILKQLKSAGVDWKDIRTIYVSHRHLDHLFGVMWLVRLICQYLNNDMYEGEASIYGNEEVLGILHDMASRILTPKEAAFIGRNLHLIPVRDGESKVLIGRKCTFFDVGSKKAKQFGFSMELDGGRKLTFCGDEPCHECEHPYARGSAWLLHEAYCLHGEADIFDPYEKGHSTAKEAAETAQLLGVENLLLYHTEDKSLAARREKYLAEAGQYFSGSIFVPEDMESIEL